MHSEQRLIRCTHHCYYSLTMPHTRVNTASFGIDMLSFLVLVLICISECGIYGTVITELDGGVEAGARSVSHVYSGYNQTALDLVFVLDRSGSITRRAWQAELSFVYSILEHFDVANSSNGVRIAVITYATLVSVDVNALVYPSGNKCELTQLIEMHIENKKSSGFTATHYALAKTSEVLMASRPHAKKVIFVITDGRSNIGPPPVHASVDLRSLRWNETRWNRTTNGPQVEIYALGVGEAISTELRAIAFPPKNHSFHLSEMTDMTKMARLIHQAGAQVPERWDHVMMRHCHPACSEKAICTCAAKSGQYTCVCGAGFYGDGSVCTACPVGTYKDVVKPGPCFQCPAYAITLRPGSSRIEQCVCPPNLHSLAPGERCLIKKCPELSSIAHGHTFHVNGHVVLELPHTGLSCENTPGHACHYACEVGYRLDGMPAMLCQRDGTWTGAPPVCKIVDCQPLEYHGENDYHAQVEYMNKTSTYGSVARITCQTGYKLFGDSLRICNHHGIWNGTPMKCVTARCPIINGIQHGHVVPNDCVLNKQIAGATCSYICNAGYTASRHVQRCGPHGEWDNNNNNTVTCRDIEDPVLICPADRNVALDDGSGSVLVDWSDSQPVAVDNSNDVTVRMLNGWKQNPIKLTRGQHKMTYEAVDAAGNKAECSWRINVLDKVINIVSCPENMTISDVNGVGQIVGWTVPVFTDHQATQLNATCSPHANSYLTIGSHQVFCHPNGHHDVTCSFSISLKRKSCHLPPAPLHGSLSCSSSPSFLHICSVMCNQGYDFHRRPRDFYYCNLNAKWNTSPRRSSQQHKPWPDCSRRHRPGKAVMQAAFEYHYYSDNCEDVKHIIRRKFQEKVSTQLRHVCRDVECQIANIDVVCGQKRRRRRRQVGESEDSANLVVQSEGTKGMPDVSVKDTYLFNSSYQLGLDTTLGESSNTTEDARFPATDVTNDPKTGTLNSLAIDPTSVHPAMEYDYDDNTTNYAPDTSISETGSVRINLIVHASPSYSNVSGNATIDDQETAYMTLDDLKYQLELELEKQEQGALNLDIDGVALAVKLESTVDAPSFQLNCSDGQIAVKAEDGSSAACVNCPLGTYKSTQDEFCLQCPLGQYQPQEAQTDCLNCPPETNTTGYGAQDLDQCKQPCSAGYWSPGGYEPCLPCPRGFFQNETHGLNCIMCPLGANTTLVSATSVDDCKETLCQNGETNDAACIHGDKSNESCIDAVTCLHNGTCVERQNNTNNNTTCICAQGYTGEHCEIDIDECMLSPCQHGGSCEDLIGRFSCYCRRGYTGQLCERKINYCDHDPCIHGICISIHSQHIYVCQCSRGYAGPNCSIVLDLCLSSPCSSRASCVSSPGAYTCICSPGFTGSRCEVDIDDCGNGPCQNAARCIDGINEYTCHCPTGFVGKECELEQSPDFDLVFETGSPRDYVLLENIPNMSAFCVCFWMRTEDNKHFGVPLSYTLDNLSGRKDAELLVGIALSDYGSFTLVLNGKSVATHVALNDGRWHHLCVSWKSLEGSWALFVNGTWIQEGRDLAANTVIWGGGKFIIGQMNQGTHGGFVLRESFIGELSQLQMFSYVPTSDTIQDLANQSRCINDIPGDVIEWTDVVMGIRGNVKLRNKSQCLDVNECIFPDVNKCGASRQCLDTLGGFSCSSCHYGNTGPDCDQPLNECDLGVCVNGATCQDGPDTYDYTCICLPGFQGKHCDELIDMCTSSPCLNHGICSTRVSGGYQCACNALVIENNADISIVTLGPRCEQLFGSCISKPCQNRGICLLDSSSKPYCICPDGFQGRTCETIAKPTNNTRIMNLCMSMPCRNGATCTSSFDKFECTCKTGWRGETCEVGFVPACDASPCQNSGTCITELNSSRGFRCICPEKVGITWSSFCQEVTPCKLNPCQNAALCVYFPNKTFSCACQGPYTGLFCETLISDNKMKQETSSLQSIPSSSLIDDLITRVDLQGGSAQQLDLGSLYLILAIIGVIILLGLIIAGSIIIIKRRRKSKPRLLNNIPGTILNPISNPAYCAEERIEPTSDETTYDMISESQPVAGNMYMDLTRCTGRENKQSNIDKANADAKGMKPSGSHGQLDGDSSYCTPVSFTDPHSQYLKVTSGQSGKNAFTADASTSSLFGKCSSTDGCDDYLVPASISTHDYYNQPISHDYYNASALNINDVAEVKRFPAPIDRELPPIPTDATV